MDVARQISFLLVSPYEQSVGKTGSMVDMVRRGIFSHAVLEPIPLA